MPGCLRHSLPHMLKEVEEAWQFGVRTFVVFPKVTFNKRRSRHILTLDGRLNGLIKRERPE